jgi:hypothetical protein
MKPNQLKRENFSYTYTDRGYMLQYKGQNIGGAGVKPDVPRARGRMVQLLRAENQQQAELAIRDMLEGRGLPYRIKAIEKIEMEGKHLEH